MISVDIISKIVTRGTGKTPTMVGGESNINLSDYLLKEIWEKVFEIKTDEAGNEYIFGKLPVVTKYGITMYADGDGVEVPSIYDGLPIDGQTLIWKDGVLMVNPELDLGGGGGIDENGLRDYLTRNDYAKKSDITTALSGYATTSSLNAVSTKLNDFLEGSDTDTVINKWKELETFLSGLTESDNLATILTGKADKSYVDTNFVTIAGTEDVTGLHNFVNGLKIGGLPITKTQDDVIYLDANLVVRGGITMYAENEVNIPSILDSLPIASNTALGIASFDSTYFSVDSNGMVSLTSAPSSGASTLGELLNVDSSIDATASVDRVLYQPAGSAMWTWKELTSSGVVGDYLPLSGGTLSGVLTFSGITEKQPLIKFPLGEFIDTYGNIQMYSTSNVWSVGLNYSALFCVTGTGKVGIGTTSPQAKLSLENGNIDIYNTSGDWGGAIGFNRKSQLGGLYNSAFHGHQINNYKGDLQFYIEKTDNTWLYPLVIQGSTGNVGIGTTNPSYKLEVIGKTGIFDYTRIIQLGEEYTLGKSKNSDYVPSGTILNIAAKENNVSSAALIAIDTTHTNTHTNSIYLGGVNSGVSNGASNFVIGRRTGVSTWAESLRIDANGNVGIGTTSPSQKLHVEGYVRIGENFIASGSIGFNRNTVVGGRFNNSYNGWQFNIATSTSRFEVYTEGTNSGIKSYWDTSGNFLVSGGVTMYSDQRKKTILNHVELSLKQIADAPLIEHYYNSDQDKTTHVGSIAQYWAGLNDWFCKLDNEGYYTMEIQNCALASAISIARHLEKYESKTDKKIRMLKKRVQELEEEVERLKQN